MFHINNFLQPTIISFMFLGEIPETAPTMFEYFWDGEQTKWIQWTKKVPKYVHDPDRKFSEILVPTVDTVRTRWLLELMVNNKQPVLLVGETGTSKTATIQDFMRDLDSEVNVRKGSLLFIRRRFSHGFSPMNLHKFLTHSCLKISLTSIVLAFDTFEDHF